MKTWVGQVVSTRIIRQRLRQLLGDDSDIGSVEIGCDWTIPKILIVRRDESL